LDVHGQEGVEGADEGCDGFVGAGKGLRAARDEERAERHVRGEVGAVRCFWADAAVETAKAAEDVKVACTGHDGGSGEGEEVLTVTNSVAGEFGIVAEGGEFGDADELVEIFEEEVAHCSVACASVFEGHAPEEACDDVVERHLLGAEFRNVFELKVWPVFSRKVVNDPAVLGLDVVPHDDVFCYSPEKEDVWSHVIELRKGIRDIDLARDCLVVCLHEYESDGDDCSCRCLVQYMNNFNSFRGHRYCQQAFHDPHVVQTSEVLALP
jgi:hypothetical protein